MIAIVGKNSFVGNYYINKYSNDNIQEICLLTNKLDTVSFAHFDSLIHLSALVHQMQGAPENSYYKINSDLAYNTAKKAKEEGVSQFLYMSTVKVYGEFTVEGEPWTEDTECIPLDPYGKSKLEGEQRIKELEDENFTISIVRTPLVYGPGVRANMYNLMKLVNMYPFIPLGNIDNKRSLTYVGNLCQLIHTVLEQKRAGKFLASDGNALSTSGLIKEISTASGKKNNIIPIPNTIQKLVKTLKPEIHRRLFGNLEIDNSYTCKVLNYIPEYTFQQGIKEMVDWYKSKK